MRRVSVIVLIWLTAVCFATRAPASELTGPNAERILDRIHSAMLAGDPNQLLQMIEWDPNTSFPGTPMERCQKMCGPDGVRAFGMHLERLHWRSVDRYRREPASSPSLLGPPDAVRVIFERTPPVETSPAGTGGKEVRAFLFVEREGQWKWYWLGGIGPWAPWEYKWDTPDWAYTSVLHAIEARDYRSVREMIDPALLPPQQSLDAWVATVGERTAAVDRAKEQIEAARAAAKAQGRPAPADVPPPFVAVGDYGFKAEARFQDDNHTVAHVSHLWNPSDRARPVPFEVFVKRGDRWYWQPRAEYSLWPLATNQAAGAATSQPSPPAPKP